MPIALALFSVSFGGLWFAYGSRMAFGLFSTVVLIINWGAWRIIQRYATPEDFESSI